MVKQKNKDKFLTLIIILSLAIFVPLIGLTILTFIFPDRISMNDVGYTYIGILIFWGIKYSLKQRWYTISQAGDEYFYLQRCSGSKKKIYFSKIRKVYTFNYYEGWHYGKVEHIIFRYGFKTFVFGKINLSDEEYNELLLIVLNGKKPVKISGFKARLIEFFSV